MAEKLRILCVCKANTCRSPMMEAALRFYLGADAHVESAGTLKETADQPANEHAIAVMREHGVDLNNHRSRWIGNLDLLSYTDIVCVSPEVGEFVASEALRRLDPDDNNHSGPRILIANDKHGGIPNPYQQGSEVYHACADTIIRSMFACAIVLREQT